MEKALREQLRKVLNWGEAHADWKSSIDGLSKSKRGVRPPGAPHSAWELLEHMRIAQWDILSFCLDPKHVSPAWPQSVEAFQEDNEAMENLVMDPKHDLFVPIAHGSGQTILRQVLLIADHN